jgi:HEPN domain-containing protein
MDYICSRRFEKYRAYFDDLYIEARYPGDLGLLPDGKPDRKDAKEFYEFAKKILDEVCHFIGIKNKR